MYFRHKHLPCKSNLLSVALCSITCGLYGSVVAVPPLQFRRYSSAVTVLPLQFRCYSSAVVVPPLQFRRYSSAVVVPPLQFRRYSFTHGTFFGKFYIKLNVYRDFHYNFHCNCLPNISVLTWICLTRGWYALHRSHRTL
jgi:hypothetical protein